MFKKLIFFLIFSLISFNSLHAKNIEDLIGKTVKLSWDGNDLKCNYTFFPWKKFSSNCTTEEYLKYSVEKFKDSGEKYIFLGTYNSGKNSFTEFMYYDENANFRDAIKIKKEGAKWDHASPKIEVIEIKYKGADVEIKKEYDFYIGIIDLAIHMEKASGDENQDTIKSHIACKNNLPKEIIKNLGLNKNNDEIDMNKVIKDFPKFSKIVKTKRGADSLAKFGKSFIEEAMSGVEKDPSEYKVPREFRSVRKTFMPIYGQFFGIIMQCAFADIKF